MLPCLCLEEGWRLALSSSETFAPTAKFQAIHVVDLAAIEDLCLRSINISHAFLNGDLDTAPLFSLRTAGGAQHFLQARAARQAVAVAVVGAVNLAFVYLVMSCDAPIARIELSNMDSQTWILFECKSGRMIGGAGIEHVLVRFFLGVLTLKMSQDREDMDTEDEVVLMQSTLQFTEPRGTKSEGGDCIGGQICNGLRQETQEEEYHSDEERHVLCGWRGTTFEGVRAADHRPATADEDPLAKCGVALEVGWPSLALVAMFQAGECCVKVTAGIVGGGGNGTGVSKQLC
ncbi:hypothetical protein FA95DRAFT_1575729 [Auriscalpium vulgare]|uniref:Uncharacterized protein n=1 Tax=Auriscalpium vulgare TaxID=40419 RepID=A0ACB8RE34_9AGAM|nr:hypothetical protein FA95DRAFT_1575729 [Auriscalpium vulgare]